MARYDEETSNIGGAMRVLCSWCHRCLGEKEPLEDNRISHSICKECVEKELQEIKDLEAEPPDSL